MSCYLTRNIKHSCDYNAGGISKIYLVDIRDFSAYQFAEDGLYDKCYVDKIIIGAEYIEIDSISEATFTESQDNGIYKQELTSFIRGLEGEKTNTMLLASSNKYVVVFSTYGGKYFTFGSDNGCTFSFSQIVGKVGESEGYSINLSKNSIYPLFQCSVQTTDKLLWILEGGTWNGDGIWTRTGIWKTI